MTVTDYLLPLFLHRCSRGSVCNLPNDLAIECKSGAFVPRAARHLAVYSIYEFFGNPIDNSVKVMAIMFAPTILVHRPFGSVKTAHRLT
jgi:hypothetical protein